MISCNEPLWAPSGSPSSTLNDGSRVGKDLMRILFLSTWFPYPLDQGSRIRAFHLLRALAHEHDVSLVSFEDRQIQSEWIEQIDRLCRDVTIVPCQPFAQPRWGSLLGWFSQRPRAVVGSFCRPFAEAVNDIVKSRRPEMVVALTFVTAPYVPATKDLIRIVDVDNLLAKKLREEAIDAKSWLQRLRRHVAYLKFERFERQLYETFDLCLVTSEGDRRAMTEYVPIPLERIAVVANGVDTHRYVVDGQVKRPFSLIYHGALTYQPNLDAMNYFVRDIWPHIKERLPETTLTITGSTQNVDLSELRAVQGVQLTGYVEDIRPWVAESSACVIPLRTGAGTRLKVLEAMALGTPVVSTSKGVEGLNVADRRELLIADAPAAFAQDVVTLLKDPSLQQSLSIKARRKVEDDYDWDKIADGFRQSLSVTVQRVHSHGS